MYEMRRDMGVAVNSHADSDTKIIFAGRRLYIEAFGNIFIAVPMWKQVEFSTTYITY
jgi:hypothetical protein